MVKLIQSPPCDWNLRFGSWSSRKDAYLVSHRIQNPFNFTFFLRTFGSVRQWIACNFDVELYSRRSPVACSMSFAGPGFGGGSPASCAHRGWESQTAEMMQP